jgi:hypothetical protein
VKTRLPKAVRRLAMVLHKSKHLGGGTSAFVRHCEAMAAVGRPLASRARLR